MTTNEIIFNVESANNVVNDMSKDMKSVSEKMYTLTKLLDTLQTKTMWAAGGETIFKRLELPETRKVSKKQFLDMLKPCQFQPTSKKDSTPCPVVWGKKLKTKSVEVEGQTAHIADLDEKGEKVYAEKYTLIRDGKWTLRTFCTVAAQRLTF